MLRSEPGEESSSNGVFSNGFSHNGATPQKLRMTGNDKASVSAPVAETLQAGASSSSLNDGTIQVEGLMDPCETGGLNACATGVATGRLAHEEGSASPSSSPKIEDRWGRTQQYSAWQVLSHMGIGGCGY